MSRRVAPKKHFVGQQPRIFGEHAEDQPVGEMSDLDRIMPTGARGLRQLREFGRRVLGQILPCLARTQPLRVRHRPFELLPSVRVPQLM